MERLQVDLKECQAFFSESEIAEMENLFRQVGEESLSQEFCREIAASFSSSTCRAGKPAVHWEQVRSWFHEKNSELLAKSSSTEQKDSSLPLDVCIPSKMPETSIVLKGGGAAELSELAFEAKSSRDSAWYDVASFLNYRVLCTGELEVRVRFAGFGIDHDEWVNARKEVRERSIPLEASECHKVKVGDLVLCFQERADYAVYVDAHVIEIQRRLHDIKGCRCIFLVRYDDDNTEDKVQLSGICRRPK
ncbi:hypothetical protein Nepgr_019527 [Nepenthes gracilis]|uniref:SAWADEE domain-containing protein n=1 Tax=Nepenthes gracilis TaxID=150966 RepID=A0AAD3XVF3_NEPGR|nr:hypothetical protein Nepgr_019527 [Nepenthes gracilis]